MTDWVSDAAWLAPALSPGTQAFVRGAYGVLLTATLVMALPHGQRFFLSERWGGYGETARGIDGWPHHRLYPLLMTGWIGAALALAAGVAPLTAALVNLILCHQFFVRRRWTSVLRGMGAPGFATYWLGAAVFLLELTRQHAPSRQPLAVATLQADLALIMLSAGVFKLASGYAHHRGLEFGLANPAWAYAWRRYARMRPAGRAFAAMNHLAWSTEVVAALLMLVPPTRFVGGLVLLVSFAFVATQIRLGFLAEMMMLATALFFHPGSAGARLTEYAAALAYGPPVEAGGAEFGLLSAVVGAGLWAYLLLLPLAHAGLSYNVYARRALPGPPQRWLEAYTNAVGLVVWRVFSADHTSFFVNVYAQSRAGGRTLLSRYGWRGGLRFAHVGESIALTTLFTSLQYYPSNDRIFRERLLRYARTIPCGPEALVVFEHVRLVKDADAFRFVPAAEYMVDPRSGAITEGVRETSLSPRGPQAGSPVYEGARPGSYAPLVRP